LRHARLSALALVCLGFLTGCQAGKQRTEILKNTQELKEELRQAREAILSKQQEGMEAAKARDEDLLRLAKAGVSSQQEILTLVKESNTLDKQMTGSLEQTYKELYGVGVDLRAAIGETRLVIAVNNALPLRVHSEIPTAAGTSEVVTELPVGGVIFQSQKISERWWKGLVMKDGEKTPVYFAVQFTKPLRDELTPPTIPSGPAVDAKKPTQ